MKTRVLILLLQGLILVASGSVSASVALPADVQQFLRPGKFVDSGNETIQRKALEILLGIQGETARIRALFEFVRDRIGEGDFRGFKASDVLSAGNGYCYNKAILLTALCRAAGIPARISLDEVYVHNVRVKGWPSEVQFVHGVTEIYINGHWRKYDQTGNAGRWKIWSDAFCLKAPQTVPLPLVFRTDRDVVFQSVGRIEFRRMDVHFFDWGAEWARVADVFNKPRFPFPSY